MDRSRRLEHAARVIKAGRMSVREAARFYDIPKSTINEHVRGARQYSGQTRPTVLSKDKEDALVIHLLALSDLGFGLDWHMVAETVKVFLDLENRQTRFTNNRPGKDWMQAFLERHKTRLSIRKAEKLILNRARGVNDEEVNEWYTRLDDWLTKLGICNKASNIHNCDETGLLLTSGQKKIICWRGMSNPLLLSSLSDKQMITMLFAVNAAGNCAPLFILYKARSRSLMAESWTLRGPMGAAYSTSALGWMDEANFYQWLHQLFTPWARLLNNEPHLLVLDGHSSHVSIHVRELAEEHNIHIFTLPPHTSHILQPLGVACYGPMKVRLAHLWRIVAKLWLLIF